MDYSDKECMRGCGRKGEMWFDGIGAQERGTARVICQPCEHRDWKATVRSLAAPQG